MFFDVHVHTCRPRMLPESNGRSYIEPEALVAKLDACGIDKALVLCIASPECRGGAGYVTPDEVIDICREYPDRLIPSCSLDPRMGTNSPESDFRSQLQFYKDVGRRLVGEYMPNLPFDDPIQLNVFKQVEEVGLPLTFHIGPERGRCYGCYDELGLPRLERVLQACPDLIQVGHSQPFWAEIRADASEENRGGYPEGRVTPGRIVDLMRQYPNLWGDLSAGSGLNAIKRDPEFGYAFLEEFQDRLCFGTDLAWEGQDAPIVDYFKQMRDEGCISEEVYEKISWKNAHRLLNIR